MSAPSPGTALTLELAEPMDDNIIIQAEYMGRILPKRRFLLRDLPDEKSVNRLINFRVASDPHYYRRSLAGFFGVFALPIAF